MPYDPKRVNLNLVDEASLQTPEQLDAAKKKSAMTFAARLGLVPTTPISAQAAQEASPSEIEAISGEESSAGNMRLLKILSAIASIFAPALGIPMAAYATGGEIGARGRAENLVGNIGKRAVKEREQSFAERQEGLTPTPSTAVPDYMTVGEARGRMANAAEDKAAKERSSSLANIEKTIAPLVAKVVDGSISPEEEERLQWGLNVLGQLKAAGNPFAGMMQNVTGGQGMNVPPVPRKKAKPAPGKPGRAPVSAPVGGAMHGAPNGFTEPYTSKYGKQGMKNPRTNQVWFP